MALLCREVQSAHDLKHEMRHAWFYFRFICFNCWIGAWHFVGCHNSLCLIRAETVDLCFPRVLWTRAHSLESRECIKGWLCLPLTLLSRIVWLKGRETNVSVPLLHLVTAIGSCQQSKPSFSKSSSIHTLSKQPRLGPLPGLEVHGEAVQRDWLRRMVKGKAQTGPGGGLESISAEHSKALVWMGKPWASSRQDPSACGLYVLWGGARLQVATGRPLKQAASTGHLECGSRGQTAHTQTRTRTLSLHSSLFLIFFKFDFLLR